MSAEFVPFLQSINSRLAAKAPAADFSPLPEGQTPPGVNSARARQGEVKVELKRDGDRISQIRIYCRCGEIIELDCDYNGS